MAKYRYTATDKRGKWITGEAEGDGPEAVRTRLHAEGLAVDSMAEADGGDRAARLRASGRDSVEFAAQLAGLARSGLPLPSGLRAAGSEVESPALRSIFARLADRVESGDDLGAAVASSRDRFPADLQGLILAGARSGRLADVLAEYVGNANLAAELRRKFWSVVAYPLITASLVLALAVVVCHVSAAITGSLLGVMRDFGVDRSSPVDALILITRLVADHSLEGLAGAATLVAGTWVLIRVTMPPAARRRLACKVPVLGPALRFTALTEFCHLLAMLLEAETPLPEALELAGRSVRDADVAEASDRMALAVAEGHPLSSAVLLWDAIPAGLGQLFLWSEGARSLPESLRLAGEMFEARARSQSGFAANVLATILVLLILWWVGFTLGALYLPLFTMLRLLAVLGG